MASNGFSSKLNFSPVRHFLLKCFTVRILWINVSALRSFTKICKRNFEIPWNVYKKV